MGENPRHGNRFDTSNCICVRDTEPTGACCVPRQGTHEIYGAKHLHSPVQRERHNTDTKGNQYRRTYDRYFQTIRWLAQGYCCRHRKVKECVNERPDGQGFWERVIFLNEKVCVLSFRVKSKIIAEERRVRVLCVECQYEQWQHQQQ